MSKRRNSTHTTRASMGATENNGSLSQPIGAIQMTDSIKAAAQAGWTILEQSVGVKKETSKKLDGTPVFEVVEVGKIKIHLPTLEAFGLKAEVKETGEDGLPIYADDSMDWLFGAIVAQCKVQARNKLINGTAELKDGQKIAENFEELTAEGERKGNAEAIKLQREAQAAFTAHLSTLGKKQETVAFLSALFKNRDALATQPNDVKDKMKGYLTGFVESLSPEDATRYTKPLTRVEEATAHAVSMDDL